VHPSARPLRVAVTSDHNGVQLKEQLIASLTRRGCDVDDRAAHIGEETVDYPPLCEDACRRVLEGTADFAVVIGGSGSGEAICCNKLKGIRAALCHSSWTAEIGRGNNDANVLVIGAKVVDEPIAEQILDAWLSTSFRGEPHASRLAMIAALERGESLLQEPEQT
jgi:ribose 5-phosphate isomerase B